MIITAPRVFFEGILYFSGLVGEQLETFMRALFRAGKEIRSSNRHV